MFVRRLMLPLLAFLALALSAAGAEPELHVRGGLPQLATATAKELRVVRRGGGGDLRPIQFFLNSPVDPPRQLLRVRFRGRQRGCPEEGSDDDQRRSSEALPRAADRGMAHDFTCERERRRRVEYHSA